VKDALVTGKRLVAAAFDLGLDRLGSAIAPSRSRERDTSGYVPRTANDVTSRWLTAVLQHSFPGVHVRAIEPICGDAGTTERARFSLEYDAVGSGPSPPRTIFLKLAPRDAKTRVFVNLMGLGANEVRFYREVAHQLSIDLPRAFHAACNGRARSFALVLEDLAARDARFTNVAHTVTLDEAQAVVGALARLHARFWNSPRFARELAWLRHVERRPNYPVERFLCATAIPAALKKHADLVPSALRDAALRIIAARDRLEAAWGSGTLTLIHGDAHVGNMYFTGSNVGLLDWQVVQCGQGMRDIAYFLTNSVPTELRRTHERELIGAYLAQLGDLGVAAPDPDTAWEQYRLHAVYAWIAAAVTAAAETLQSAPIVRAGLVRTSTAMMDLASVNAATRL